MLIRILSVTLLIFLAPLFCLIFAIIFLEDGFPVIFKQKRIGINNTFFIIYKFRTMRRETPNIATNLMLAPENYLLKSGKILRKMSFDELPNLINVMKGDMVFVGPRPALFNQLDLINLRSLNGVDKLKPGITGWAQVNGRDDLPLIEKVRFDKEYLKNKSLLFDLKIFCITVLKIFNNQGISH